TAGREGRHGAGSTGLAVSGVRQARRPAGTRGPARFRVAARDGAAGGGTAGDGSASDDPARAGPARDAAALSGAVAGRRADAGDDRLATGGIRAVTVRRARSDAGA